MGKLRHRQGKQLAYRYPAGQGRVRVRMQDWGCFPSAWMRQAGTPVPPVPPTQGTEARLGLSCTKRPSPGLHNCSWSWPQELEVPLARVLLPPPLPLPPQVFWV